MTTPPAQEPLRADAAIADPPSRSHAPTPADTAARAHPLRWPAKFGYGLGAVVDGVTSNALNFFLMFYATVVCGLGGTRAGIALSAGLIADAVLDPLIGSLSDRTRSRFGRRIPFMMAGLPLTAIALVLIFSLPAGMDQPVLFGLLLALSMLLRVSISLFNLPYLALGAELSDDYAERSSIAAWRWGLGMLGGLAVVVIGFGDFFKGPDGAARHAAYPAFALSIAAVMLAGAGLSIIATMTLRHRAHAVGTAHPAGFRALIAGFVEVARNPSFAVLFVSTLLLFVAQGVTFTLNLHANTYFWKLSPEAIQYVALALFVGLLVGAPAAAALAGRMEKRTMLFASIAGLILSQVALASLRLAGALPIEGEALAWLLVANAVLNGLAITGAVIAGSSMLADAADDHELRFGRRREGLFFAGWSFASKAAGGLGALVAGIALDLGGFPKGGSAGHILPTPHAVAALAFTYGPGAALFSVAGLIVLLRYRLDRRRHAEIMQQLTTRR